MRTTFHTAALSLASLLVASGGCNATTTQTPPTRPAPRPTDAGPLFETPARWVAFPQNVGTPQATLALDDGTCLVTTDDGQRWIVQPKDKAQPCVGTGRASGSPTMESLVGAQRLGEEFRFIGEGGTVYTSREPNGPFVRHARAPTFLRRVAAKGSSIVGLDDAGKTYFYDGSTWKGAEVPQLARGVDVAADAQGRVLWLGVPETILVSSDSGRTFTAPTSAPSRIGAWEAGFTTSGQLGVRGVSAALVLDGDALKNTTEPISDVVVGDVEIEPMVGPRAGFILEGRATFEGRRYYEILDAFEEDSRYGLGQAIVGTASEKKALKALDACENVKIAAATGVIAFACTKPVEDDPSPRAEIYVSKDGGTTLDLVTTLLTPSFTDVGLTVASDGTVLVVGACKPAAPKAAGEEKKEEQPTRGSLIGDEDSSLCNPKGPVVVRAGAVTAGTVPYLEPMSARSPLLSLDGRTAYFIGRNRKDQMPAVFVSRDGGQTYQMRTIEAPQSSSWEDDEYVDPDASYARPLYLSEGSTLEMDETGSIGVVAERDSGYAWITLDADGRIANVGEPPEPSYQIGGVGNRVLALGYGQMDGMMRAWESLDGGVNWAEVALTPAVQQYGAQGGPMICALGGCLLGDELVRVGWEGQSEAAMTMGEELFPDPPDVQLGAALSCQLSPKSEWMSIDGKPEERPVGGGYASYSSVPSFPRAREMMRGKTIWSIASIADDGKIDITAATVPEKDGASPAIAKKPFLAASKAGKGGYVSTTLRAQGEGYAALRAEVPLSKHGGIDYAKKLEKFEIAYSNQLLGTFGKKVVSLDGNWTGTLSSGTVLRPSLLTISMQGVVVQPYAGAKGTYVDASTSLPFDFPNVAAQLADKRGTGAVEITNLAGRLFALSIADRSPNAQVALTYPVAASPTKAKGAKGEPAPTAAPGTIEAVTMAPAYTEVDFFFSGDKVGFVAYLTSSEEGVPPSIVGYLLDEDGKPGAPIDLPTLADLVDRPQPCSAEDRKTTPRVTAPNFGRSGAMLFPNQARHPVMVTDTSTGAAGATLLTTPMEPIWLLTSGAVLHGTKKDPCVAAWHAAGTRPGFVAVVGGNPDHSFLFRQTSGVKSTKAGGTGRWTQQIEVRPMTCRYQSDLVVPFEVLNRSRQRQTDDQP